MTASQKQITGGKIHDKSIQEVSHLQQDHQAVVRNPEGPVQKVRPLAHRSSQEAAISRRVRRINYTTDGSYSAWSCKTHLGEKSKCSMLFIRDNDLKLASEAIMNKLIFAHRLILKPYAESLKRNSTSCRRSSSERPTASRTTMPSPMKSLNHSPSQTPATARRPGSAPTSCRTSSEVSNPKSPNSTKASSER